MSGSTRRFIAGAVCPRCAEMDRIVMYRNEQGQFRACVSCGFEDKMPDESMDAPSLETRVNKAKPEPDTLTQPVRIFPPPKR